MMIDFLYDLNINYGIFLWADNGKLKYRKYKNIENQQEIFKKIDYNKQAILDILIKNNIISSEICLPVIYRQKNTFSPLSFAQERLWFIDRYEDGTSAYNVPIILRLNRTINIEALKNSLLFIAKRHQVLMATIKADETGNYFQCVLDESLVINDQNCTNEQELEEQLSKDTHYQFNLEEEKPIKIWIYYSKSQKQPRLFPIRLLINIHHIACDGWSIDVLLKELKAYYHYFNEGRSTDLPELTIQYKDFAVWQRVYLKGAVLSEQLNYWKKELLGFETLIFPTDKTRPPRLNYSGDNILFELNGDQSDLLKQIAREQGVTLYTVLLSIFEILLFHYTGQEDLIIGTPVANRHYLQLEHLIGFFVNNLVIRTKLDRQEKIEKLIQRIHQTLIQAQINQDIPFEKLVEELQIEKDTSRHPIFQIMFSVQSFGKDPQSIECNDEKKEEPFTLNALLNQYKVAKFDLSLFIDDSKRNLNCRLNYATSLFNSSSAQQIATHFCYLTKQLTDSFQENRLGRQSIKDFQLLTNEEYQRVIYENNKTDRFYPQNKTIHELFEERVAEEPDNIAVIYEGQKLTYRELNNKANQLAGYIRKRYKIHTKKALQAGTLIALCLERGHEMVVAILATLKAGGAYVPIDPNYPDERIQFILKDAKSSMLLTQSHLRGRLKLSLYKKALSHELEKGDSNVDILAIDERETNQALSKFSVENLNHINNPDDLIYVIYTSGTTGKPKGVMIEHKNVVNFTYACAKVFNLKEGVQKNCLQFASITFDATIFEIFFSLSCGHRLFVISEEKKRDKNKLDDFFKINKIHVTLLPPALLKTADFDFVDLEILIVGGDKAEENILNKYFDKNIKVFNAYGPTEGTVCSSINRYAKNGFSNIGKALPNIKLYILDLNFNPVPFNIVGELYIGGASLARGYLNRPELTKERFVNNPFATEEDKARGYTRLYKTGDLVRWLPDGNLEYIGRNDFQVKIRGFRIELGEIENTLSKIAGIKQVTVQAKDRQVESENDQYFVAYYVAEKSAHITQDEITNYLSRLLPEYMIPSFFVELAELPLTINGKIDRNSLPAPEVTNESCYVVPTTDLERQVSMIWKEVLGVERVGVTDDFFKMGGHSLSAIRVSHKMSALLERHIAVAEIFYYKTIRQIINYTLGVKTVKILPTYEKKAPLSFAQERLLFIDRYEEGTNAYNIPISLQLSSNTDIDAFQKSLNMIVQRHEVLRTIFKQDKETEKYYQELLPMELTITHRFYTNDEDFDERLIKDSNYVFNLEKEIPIKVWIYESKDKGQEKERFKYILLNIHHIAFDGWSIELLFNELNSCYRHHVQQEKLKLPNLTIQYKDFAIWQRSYLTGVILDKQLSYWKAHLVGYENLELPTDKNRPNRVVYKGDKVRFKIDIEDSRLVRELAQEQGITLYTVLLSIFNILLSRYCNQEDIILGSPVANRHYPQLEYLIGFFVNTLVLRIKVHNEKSIHDFIQETYHYLIEAQKYQDLPFEKLVEELKIEQDMSRHPLFQVMFGVQNFENNVGKQNEAGVDIIYKQYNAARQYEVAKFDLSLFIDDSQTELHGYFNYAISLFNKEKIQQLSRHYKYLVSQFIKHYKEKQLKIKNIGHLEILTKEECQRLVCDYNQTNRAYSQDKTIHELFEEQVKKTPDAIAVIYENQELTYQEINERSNQLARHIRDQYKTHTKEELSADTLIALCLDRNYEMIIAILAVLKAGGAYVPLDIAYPEKRLEFILEDTNCSIILSQERIIESFSFLKKNNRTVICLDRDSKKISILEKRDLRNINKGIDLSYVIYTSGSTGKPKGIILPHRTIVNLVHWRTSDSNKKNKRIIAQFAPLGFDVSIYEICYALLNGYKLCIVPLSVRREPAKLIDFINYHNIDECILPPSILEYIANDVVTLNKKLPHLKDIIFTGEALKLTENIRSLYARHPGLSLTNYYGPSETHVITSYEFPKNVVTWPEAAIIGKPISNTKIFIVLKNMQLAPPGIVGEIYVGGDSLAREYLGDIKLTQKKFIANPFLSDEEKEIQKNNGIEMRLYRTGDMGRWLNDGSLEFLGRIDNQINIRGHRIELAEVEAAISEIKGIKQVLVDVREKENEGDITKYLVAYYVPELQVQENQRIDQETIRAHLSQCLPDYMIPSAYIQLEQFSLTVNGKLDKKGLPDPEFKGDRDKYVAPTNEIEQKLCKIWEKMLGVEKVGTMDNFFMLGGNSILAMQLCFKINNIFNSDIKISELFSLKKIVHLAERINHCEVGQEIEI